LAPRTDGTAVVWAQEQNGDSSQSHIWAARIGTTITTQVAAGPAVQGNPDIDQGIAVWSTSGTDCTTCGQQIVGKNLNTGQSFTVSAPSEADAGSPAISGDWVVWLSLSQSNTQSIQARNIATMAPPVTVAQVGFGAATNLALDGTRVVWAEQQAEEGGSSWKFYTKVIGASEAPTLLDQGAGYPFTGCAISGNMIVYAANYHLILITLTADGTPSKPETIANFAQAPTTDGHDIYWEDFTAFNTTDSQRIDLVGYDLATGRRFSVVTNDGQNVGPAVRNGVLVWQQTVGNRPPQVKAEIVGTPPPETPLPNPGTTNPNWTYFPQTGHYLAYGFRSFWSNSGGLPVFGYPLTEEFSQKNPDTGATNTVQYFERQRFEYHPELAGTPYETELGRLGAELAQQQDLLDTAPFKPLPANTPSDANCTFFAATGHRLCFGFRDYWQTHGLDFGDPGISFRESLALFGYPISEEFTDPAIGLTAQYFERAVFEYHPNNPAPYRVLLSRLGANLLAGEMW
ncbi:MAG TPA: hypothetical protein VKU87_08090, partial [Thermomicrobiaceae bacterium]|nr:hypothetical protein [Thermomicrobiaceae bacterium]